MKIKQNILANFLGSGWSALLSFLFVPVYIRYLGMEAYSLVGIFSVMQAWLSMLDVGMTPTLNREMARYSAGDHTPQSIWDLLRSLEFIAAGIFVFITISIYLLSGYLAASWLKVESLPLDVVAQSLSLSAVVIGLRFIEGLYRSCLFGLEKQVWYNSANSILVALRWIGVIGVLQFASNSIQAFFIWQALVSILALITFSQKTYSLLQKPDRPPKFSKAAITKIKHFAGGMLVITLLAIVLTQVDKLLLSRMLPLKEFGYYALATTVTAVIALVSSPITQAVYPRLVVLVSQKKETELVELYHTCAQLISTIACPIFAILAFFPYELIYLWTNDPIISKNVSSLLMPLALGTVLNTVMWVPYQLQLAHGWTSFSLKVNFFAVLVLIPAIILVVPRHGSLGAAWVWAILNFGYVFISVPLMHRYVMPKEMWRWYFKDLLLPIFFACVSAVVLQKLKPQLANERILTFVWLSFSGAVCFFCAFISAKNLRIKAKLLLTGIFSRS
jgi:O-antigen/teichoic acid export membrane protein